MNREIKLVLLFQLKMVESVEAKRSKFGISFFFCFSSKLGLRFNIRQKSVGIETDANADTDVVFIFIVVVIVVVVT